MNWQQQQMQNNMRMQQQQQQQMRMQQQQQQQQMRMQQEQMRRQQQEQMRRQQQEQMRRQQEQMRRQQEQMRRDQQMRMDNHRRQQEQMRRDQAMREQTARTIQTTTQIQHATMMAAAGGGGGAGAGAGAGDGGLSDGGLGDGGLGGGDDFVFEEYDPNAMGPGGYRYWGDGPMAFVTFADDSSISMQGNNLVIMSGTGGFAQFPKPEEWVSAAEAEAIRARTPTEPVSHIGYVTKLSKSKKPILGGRMWQRRFLVLDGYTMTYYKTYEDAQAGELQRGQFQFKGGSWAEAVERPDPLRKDAFQLKQQRPSVFKLMANPMSAVSKYQGTVGKDHVFAIHVPSSAADQIGAVTGALNGGSVFTLASRVNKAREAVRERTYYFQCDTDEERDTWLGAINLNLAVQKATGATREAQGEDIRRMLKQAGVQDVDDVDMPALLDDLLLKGKGKATAAASADSAAASSSSDPAAPSAPPPSAPPPSAPPPSSDPDYAPSAPPSEPPPPYVESDAKPSDSDTKPSDGNGNGNDDAV